MSRSYTAGTASRAAREAGARALVLNPIEGLKRDEEARGVGYVELMEANLCNLRTALGCQWRPSSQLANVAHTYGGVPSSSRRFEDQALGLAREKSDRV
jgi:hypothetical protein